MGWKKRWDMMGYDEIPSGKRLQKAINMAIEIVSFPVKKGDFP